MIYIIGTMIGFYILNFWIFGFIGSFLFPWGGVGESYLYPIYSGMILLSGLIVACTKIVLDEMKELKKNEHNRSKK